MTSGTTVRNGDRIIDFDKEGVTFIFPPALDDIYVLRKELYTPPEQGGFEAKRPLINVKLYRITNGKVEPATEFDPPFKIEIHYKQKDDDNASKEQKDKECAFFIESTQNWVRFTQQKHGFDPKKYDAQTPTKKKKARHKGFGVATISEWPDPLIGWGP